MNGTKGKFSFSFSVPILYLRRISNQSLISKGKYLSDNPKSLYKCIPSPIIRVTLPLHCYAGTYEHVAYGPLKIYLDETDGSAHRLRADRSEFILPEHVTFEHVSGEFFVARTSSVVDFGALYDDIFAVEFRIGADGKVKEVGVGWEDGTGKEKIWLQRVADQ